MTETGGLVLRIALLAAATLLAACSSSTEPGATPPIEGCYDIVLGQWDRPADDVPPLPLRVALRPDTGSHVLESGRRLVRALPDSSSSFFRWSWWEPVGVDSVALVFSTGFTGVHMRLRRTGGGATGEARTFVDYLADPSVASAELRRVGCS
jgi:hypothetical protein